MCNVLSKQFQSTNKRGLHWDRHGERTCVGYTNGPVSICQCLLRAPVQLMRSSRDCHHAPAPNHVMHAHKLASASPRYTQPRRREASSQSCAHKKHPTFSPLRPVLWTSSHLRKPLLPLRPQPPSLPQTLAHKQSKPPPCLHRNAPWRPSRFSQGCCFHHGPCRRCRPPRRGA